MDTRIMKLPKIPILLFCLMALTACKAGTKSNELATATATEEPKFLKDMGIETKEIYWLLGEGLAFGGEDVPMPIDLTAEQAYKLIGQVEPALSPDPSGDPVPEVCIPGMKQLPGGNFLIVFLMETGDDAALQSLGTYNAEGSLLDYVTMGITRYHEQIDAGENMMLSQSSYLGITGDDTFTLTCDFSQERWSNVEGDEDGKLEEVVWKISTVYCYKVGADGLITLGDIKDSVTGDPQKATAESDYDYLKSELACMDINHNSYYPMSDKMRIDRLNDYCATHTLNEDIEAAATNVLRDFFSTNPQQLLEWVAANEGKANNRLTALLRTACADGMWLLEKSRIKAEIAKMPNAAQHRRVEQILLR